jgi:cyclopropane fatty-acyl-phospholipid synthase-like methyltransferase
MRKTDLDYYQTVTLVAPMRFALDAVFTKNKIRRLSMVNRMRDYLRLASSPSLLPLHAELNRSLYESAAQYDGYDYGEGYFYQSMAELGISGLRDTDARVDAMTLRERLSGLTVLEIGCNAGFLANIIASVARSITCLDTNSHLIDIARTAARHSQKTNLTALPVAFEDFTSSEGFDAVLSFANHSTYDGNTRQSVEEYFLRCRSLLRPGGLFLFESHAPAYEGDDIIEVCRLIETHFQLEHRSVLNYGTYLDRGRTFIVGRA